MQLEQQKLKNILEAVLMVADEPLNEDRLLQLFMEDERPDVAQLREALELIMSECEHRGVELTKTASGYRFQSRADYSEWIARLWQEKPPKYSRAMLETLAIIAYRQPITRAEIEEIRGVSVSSNILKTLSDHQWVDVVGHRDVPGKPGIYATTRYFLDYFNLKNLTDLPPLADIKEIALPTTLLEQQQAEQLSVVADEASEEQIIAEAEIEVADLIQQAEYEVVAHEEVAEPQVEGEAVADEEEIVEQIIEEETVAEDM